MEVIVGGELSTIAEAKSRELMIATPAGINLEVFHHLLTPEDV